MQKPLKDSPQHNSTWLDPEEFEYLCFDFTRELLSFNEPSPDYATRDDGLLQSALGSPQQTFDGKLLYPSLEEQAAILFYSLIKNHPFRNGNKRIGVMALLAFLSLNHKWLSVSPSSLYESAREVSLSLPSEKEEVLSKLKKYIADQLIDPEK